MITMMTIVMVVVVGGLIQQSNKIGSRRAATATVTEMVTATATEMATAATASIQGESMSLPSLLSACNSGDNGSSGGGGSNTTIKSTKVATMMAAAEKVIVATTTTRMPLPSFLTFNRYDKVFVLSPPL